MGKREALLWVQFSERLSLRRSVSGMTTGAVMSSTCMRLPVRFTTAALSLSVARVVSWSLATR
nr:MAG TPA: hypothetical protein [Caudoviricetes sp.]